jgi:hypothetical protein
LLPSSVGQRGEKDIQHPSANTFFNSWKRDVKLKRGEEQVSRSLLRGKKEFIRFNPEPETCNLKPYSS